MTKAKTKIRAKKTTVPKKTVTKKKSVKRKSVKRKVVKKKSRTKKIVTVKAIPKKPVAKKKSVKRKSVKRKVVKKKSRTQEIVSVKAIQKKPVAKKKKSKRIIAQKPLDERKPSFGQKATLSYGPRNQPPRRKKERYIQSVIISKRLAFDLENAKCIAEYYGLKTCEYDITPTSYRFRQYNPKDFYKGQKGHWRTFKPQEHVSLIYATSVKSRRNAMIPTCD